MTGHLANTRASSACNTTSIENGATLPFIRRCDGDADESILSLCLVESAVQNVIGKFNEIKPVTVQVVIKNEMRAQILMFTRKGAVPRLVLHLSAGLPALLNGTLLVGEAELEEYSLHIGQSVLKIH